ncbi:MAG: hypothetical protein FD166_3129 [Bacteroidetes bacterium]|nr:MAG: hypothetical protein FD166_3129 [Bacteroidota bacterium]
MSQKPLSIPKKPVLKPAADYYRLRREGIGHIEQMGSRQWTDYNTHDPGITILEALCYAITDLAYRTGQDIRNILTKAEPPADKKNPYPDQAFFTAREILTVNPWTTNDFRKLLIDAEGVRNAWLICRECDCDVHYYAWCDEDRLMLAYAPPANPDIQPVKVSPRGLYEVLLELEEDPETGDLNNRKVEFTYQVYDGDGKPHPVIMEVRFPDWSFLNKNQWELFLHNNDAFNGANGASFNLNLLQFGATKDYNVISDPLLNEEGKNNYLHRQWRNLFYADLELEFLPGGEKIIIEDITLRLLGDTTAKNGSTVSRLEEIMTRKETGTGILQQYRSKMLKAEAYTTLSKGLLHAHRNLDEDYCRVKVVDIEEVAVCADIEVTPDADIELVQARVWFEIERYLNPPVPFYSLQELMNEGRAGEDIFNGPALGNGFIATDELENAQLKAMIKTSDIINLLMEIEGVVAINNLLLSKYDTEGNIVKGAADPAWVNGNPVFDGSKTSAQWLLFISENHQPRLYLNLSRFLFFKNGLPFTPRMDEARDTLTQLRGEAERPKYKNSAGDLYPSPGTFTDIEEYFPVQNSLPMIFGVGTEGLPSHAGEARRAMAKQLKAYLLVYEQLLGNAFAQVAHTGDLFSLDPATRQTYFVRQFSEELIRGYDEIVSGLTTTGLEGMTETLTEFHERRNRFLDHLMARFGEQFSEYALLLTNLQGKPVAMENLIEDKTAFLKAYPEISHSRGKAFNYMNNPCSPTNISGLKKRFSLLLVYPDLRFEFTLISLSGTICRFGFTLKDSFGRSQLNGEVAADAPDEKTAEVIAGKTIVKQMIRPDAWLVQASGDGFTLRLNDKDGNLLGSFPDTIVSTGLAVELKDEFINWSSNERAIVVEHLLLRPRFPGDALYPACSDGSCVTCGDEDPYSFRLTVVMPGWTGPFSVNTDARRFADRTIRQEIPSHLLGKICWAGNDGFIQNLCDEVISELTGLIMKDGFREDGTRPSESEACACANAVYLQFSAAFIQWYEDKTLEYIHPDALKAQLANLFSTIVPETACTSTGNSSLTDKIRAMLVGHFTETAINGWQFERLEEAWCNWLRENAAIDRTEEMLTERVEAMLKAGFLQGATGNDTDLCHCAGSVLSVFGAAFHSWMNGLIVSGIALTDLPEFAGAQVDLCQTGQFKPGTAEAIRNFLTERYNYYRKASYTLQVFVNQLAGIRNVYPGATLHDCVDGSDQNPVRLGSTSLGNYPMKRSIMEVKNTLISRIPEPRVRAKKPVPVKASRKSSKKKKPPKA